CALVPMRSIPFRVVCLLGMNDDDFPRVRRPLGFDLIAQRPLPGDRWLRNDDRYLFLEAILSARERLLITYVGQSIRDNAERSPAVVLSELLDTLGESFRVGPTLHPSTDAGAPRQDSESARGSGRDAIEARIVVRHPLQPFSPRYFLGDAALFSYAEHYCAGARALQQPPRSSRPPFVSAPLPTDDSAHTVTLDHLLRFFENPPGGFLQRRVGLHLGKDVDRLEDREPMEPDALERWKIGNGLLARAVEGEDLDAALASVRATGSLPPGALGTCLYDDLSIEVMRLAGAVTRLAQGEPLAVVAVDAEVNATRVTGLISDVWPSGLVRYQYSKLGQRQELALWIRHLVLNWLAPLGYPRDSFLVGRPTRTAGPHTVHFRPVKNAAAILADLLHLFWVGQLLPLPLFEASSRRYASALRKKGRSSVAHALAAARKAYCADEHRRGDVSDAYVQQLYGACDPLDPEFHWFDGDEGMPRFHAVAQAVFAPLLDHREEIR